MRKIIKGKTYDTETATYVAKDTYEDQEGVVTEWLYQTKGGAFFLIQDTALMVEDRDGNRVSKIDEYGHEIKKSIWSAFSREYAEYWFNNGKNVDLSNEEVFSMPEEASTEDEEDRTISMTVRVPASLRDQLSKAASKESISMNAYMVRCAKRCLAG